jgi:hypothetical protein
MLKKVQLKLPGDKLSKLSDGIKMLIIIIIGLLKIPGEKLGDKME